MKDIVKQILVALLIASVLWLSKETYSNTRRLDKVEVSGVYITRDMIEIKSDLKEIKNDIKDLLKERRD